MFILYDKNMNKIEYPDGVTPLDIFISSISKERITEKIEGRHGSVDYGYTYGTRGIELKLLLQANDTKDYRLLRDAVYALFQSNDEIYVSEEYQPGKKHLVTIDEQFIPERIPNNRQYAEVTINCTNKGLPFAESIATTADIDKNGLLYSDEKWSYGMGLLYDEESHKYTHRISALNGNTTFRIYNAGIDLHPFQQDLKITVDDVSNASGFTLLNQTTGDEFKYNETLSGKRLVLDGPNVTVNGLQAFRDTNRKFISLAQGWNDFKVSGALDARIAFDFPFYYL